MIYKKYSYYLMFFLLAVVSCDVSPAGKSEDKQQLKNLENNLKESNKIIENYIAERELDVEQIFYLRCINSADLRNKFYPLKTAFDNFLEKIDSIQCGKKDFEKEKLIASYEVVMNKFEIFTKGQKHWKVNNYKLYRNNYSPFDENLQKFVLLAMKNDMLISQSELYDYVLFYSICVHKPSAFVRVKLKKNPATEKNQYSLHVISEIPGDYDYISTRIKVDTLLMNKRLLNPDKYISMGDSITHPDAFGTIYLKQLEPGKYRVKGKINLLRQSFRDGKIIEDTSIIHLPFSHEFKIKLNK